MWCNNCQQDVPALGRAGTTKLICSRCHSTLPPPHAVGISEAGIALDDVAALEVVDKVPPLLADDWQLRRRTRNLSRKLRHDPASHRRRADSSQNMFADLAAQTAAPIVEPGSYTRAPQAVATPRPESGQFAAWFVTFLGCVALIGGLGFIGWTVAHGGSEYWYYALALTLTGQGILILGLVLVVTRLWRNSRYATGRLQQVHLELGQLQRTADAISAMRTGGSPAFYG
ncbi:MAG: hypothetical protein AB7U97_12385, partial [Pirellulales bacterium]